MPAMPAIGPVSPLQRLEVMLASELTRLGRRRDELADLGDALLALRSQVATEDSSLRLGVEVLDQAVAAPVLGRLAASVGQVDSVFLDSEVGAVTDVEHASHALDRARAGQRQRTIYTRAVVDDPDNAPRLDALRSAGQEQHVVETFAHELAIFGDDVAVTPSAWGDPGSAYLVIRNPVLIGAFQGWFNHVWSATPSRDHGAPVDQRVVELLALGYKDEAIARHLGVALRTVRRRVAALMDDYQVHTRFQLGAALAHDDRA